MAERPQSRRERNRKKQPVTLKWIFKKYWVFFGAALIVVISTVLLYAGLETAHMASDKMESVAAEESARPMDIIEDVNQEVYTEEAAEQEAPRAVSAYVEPEYDLQLPESGLPTSDDDTKELADEAVRWVALLLGKDLTGAEVAVEGGTTQWGGWEGISFMILPQGETAPLEVNIDLATKELMYIGQPESQFDDLNWLTLTEAQLKEAEKECVKQLVPFLDIRFGSELRVTNVVDKNLFFQAVNGESTKGTMALEVFFDNGRSCYITFKIQKDFTPVFESFYYRTTDEAAGERKYIEENMPELLW